MASPQKENGYTAISNEILENLIKYEFPKNTGSVPFRICLFIMRKTYGWNKKEDHISFTQFQEALGVSRPVISHWIKYLVTAKLLVVAKVPDKRGFIYSFNKDYDKWLLLVNPLLLVVARAFTSKVATTATSKVATTHKRNKTITKEIPAKAGSKNMKTFNYDTGEYQDEAPKSNKRAEVIILAKLFDKMASDLTGRPIITPKSYFIVLNAINKHKLKPKGVEQLFNDWFSDSKIKNEEKVNLSFALSAGNINSWKTKN